MSDHSCFLPHIESLLYFDVPKYGPPHARGATEAAGSAAKGAKDAAGKATQAVGSAAHGTKETAVKAKGGVFEAIKAKVAGGPTSTS